jgi:hypothetical protein
MGRKIALRFIGGTTHSLGSGLQANMELDEGAVLPTQAFEVFMGKVYST